MIKKPHVDPAPKHREIWLEDPNGYVVASPDGEAAARTKAKAPKPKARRAGEFLAAAGAPRDDAAWLRPPPRRSTRR